MRGEDSRLDAWPLSHAAVSGVGSLPFRRFDAALRFVRSTARVAPYLPELPRLPSASMLDAIDAPRDPLAAERFVARLPRTAQLIKLQLCGPLTYALARGLRVDRAMERVGRIADALLAESRVPYVPTLIVIDEPGLTGAPRRRVSATAPLLRDLFTRIREHTRSGAPTFAGLHCCGRLDLRVLSDADPDFFSFDAWNALESVLEDGAFQSWFRRRRALGLGLVPTESPEGRVSHSELAKRSTARVRNAFENAGLRVTDMPMPLLTGSCGFGLSTLAWTKRAHATLGAIERILQREPLTS